MADNYNIPLSIDLKGVLTGLDQVDKELAEITAQAKVAGQSMTEALSQSARSSDALVNKMNAGAIAAKSLQDAAKGAGVELGKAFAPDKIDTNGLQTKVATFVAKMKDAIGKPVNFNFDFDKAKIDILTKQLGGVTDQMEGFDIVLQSAKDGLKDFVKGSDPFNQLSKQIQDAEKFLNVLREDIVEVREEVTTPVQDSAIQEIGEQAAATEPRTTSLRARIRELREELANMELAGEGGTERFRQLSIEAGELADQFGDTSQRVRALASDTKGLDAGISAVRGLAGAFAVGQGALAAFGEQSEEAAIAIQKVQGAMAILQGVQEIANVLNKDSALSIYLQTFATREHTAAVVADTAAVGAETVATEGAVVATNAWTAALLANPITAIIAVLAIAAVALYKFSEAQKQSGLSAEQFNKALEQQQELLDQDLARIKRRQTVAEAQADAERKNQSDLTQIRINALAQEKGANQVEIEEQIRLLSQLDRNDKDYEKSHAEGLKRINDLEAKKTELTYQILSQEIAIIRQRKDEEVKLEQDLLKEKQTNYDQRLAIEKAAREYSNQILNAHIQDLRDGQKKEIAALNQALAEKIQGIEDEAKANTKKLKDERANLQLELQIADENGKKVIAQQLADNARQLAADQKNQEQKTALITALTESRNVAVDRINEKFREEQIQADLDVQIALLELQKDSNDKRQELLNLAATKEIESIRAKHLTEVEEEKKINVVLQKLDKDKADAELDYNLTQLNIDKQFNANKINELDKFKNQSIQVQELKNIVLLQNELKAAQDRLELLKKAGKDERDEQVVQAQAAVDSAQEAIVKAQAGKTPKTFFSLIFPDANPQQLQFLTSQIQSTFASIGQAIDSYSQIVQSRYQAIIDAKKAMVQADDDAIKSLQDQLATEQELRDKGYANNVQGILAQIAAKEEARQRDIESQEDAQKKLEKSQKLQAQAQTALQAANLITAATNIYLQATAVGGPFAVPVAIAAISAMVAAFALSKIAAAEAVNTPVQSFEHGGEITGRSHKQGGQRYIAPDSSGGVVELEAGEYVVKKKQYEKFKPLIEAINGDSIGGMTDAQLEDVLSGLGVHVIEKEHKDALREARIHTTNVINATMGAPAAPKELAEISAGVQQLVTQNNNTERVYEEGDYTVRVKGNKTTKIRKR